MGSLSSKADSEAAPLLLAEEGYEINNLLEERHTEQGT